MDGDGDDNHLKSVEGGRKTLRPRAGRRRSLAHDEQIQCWQCESDTGVATSMALNVLLAPRRSPSGRVVDGSHSWVCVQCLARGKVTTLSK